MKGKSFETKTVYICLSIAALCCATLAILISNGKLFSVFFFSDTQDTGMDFFNSLVSVHTRKPYEDFHSLYPPFANFFFYTLQLFIPDTIKEAWPNTHMGTIYMVGTEQDLRLRQSSFLIFLFFVLITVFLFYYAFHSMFQSTLLAICLTASFGVIYAIERGNVILITFLLLFFFIKNYKNQNKIIHELSLLALAMAFGFKLYPAIFGILLLKDKQFFSAIRSAFYGITLSIISLLVFEGFSAIPYWLETLNIRSFGDTSTHTQTNASSISFRLISILLCIIILLLDLFFEKKIKIQLFTSQRLFLITYLMLLIINGADIYNLIFFLIPFVYFLQEENIITRYNFLEFLLYLYCLLPLGINSFKSYYFPFFLLGNISRILSKSKSH